MPVLFVNVTGSEAHDTVGMVLVTRIFEEKICAGKGGDDQ